MSNFPIVGAHFHPPAKALISILSIGTRLELIAEPDNAADPNAIAIWLSTQDIPESAYETLGANAGDYGFDLEQILAEPMWHLGYIPRDMTHQLLPLSEPREGTFSLSASGAPRIRIEG